MVLGDSLALDALPSVIVDNGTLASNAGYYLNKTYTVTGNGVIIVYAALFSDNTNDYGTWRVVISHNDTTIMAESTRFASSTADCYGSSTSVPIQVQNGDTIQVDLYNSKVGAKTAYRRFLCFGGCTVS